MATRYATSHMNRLTEARLGGGAQGIGASLRCARLPNNSELALAENAGGPHQGPERERNGEEMAFKPNYQQQKAERARAKALKKQEKQERLEEQSSKRHEDAEAGAPGETDANKGEGEEAAVDQSKPASS